MPTLEKSKFPWIPAKQKQTGNKSWTPDERYHTRKWRNYRARFLLSRPLCMDCKKVGKTTPANVVDHIIPISKDASDENFWNSDNHQALCKSCNNRKAVTDRKLR